MRQEPMVRWGLGVCFALLLQPPDSWGRGVLAIGQNGQITWEGEVVGAEGITTIAPEYRSSLDPNVTEIGTSPSDLIDFRNPEFPESILPRKAEEAQNLAAEAALRGGGLSAPTVLDISEGTLQTILDELISDKPPGKKAFERKESIVMGTMLVLDLGARIGVNRIRFFPRNTLFDSPTTPFQNDFLRNFELQINGGVVLTKGGNPIWETYEIRANNTEQVTVIDIDPPRYIRFVRLRATSSLPFEIVKLQVFGEGFSPSAQYLSPVIDMRTEANWGPLRWEQELVGDPEKVGIQIRTRSGSDPTPFVYTRKLAGKKDAEETPFSVNDPSVPLSRKEYLALPTRGGSSDVWERGSVGNDPENWSPWSAPYSVEQGTSAEGTPILSPGPRRYFQFRVDLASEDLESAVVLRRLSFDFATPPLADALIGEVFPREVPAAMDVPFIYALRAEMESPGLQGFDSLELHTGRRVERIERIEIIDSNGGILVDHTFAVEDAVTEEGEVAITSVTDQGLAIRFPRIEKHNTVLKLHFVTRVLAYSTAFEGRALALAEDAFQGVIPGDAATLDDADVSSQSGVTVVSPSVTKSSLIGSFSLGPGVFTPNGDLVNDKLELSYEVLAIVGQARIIAEVLDLAGRRMRCLFDQAGENGEYSSAKYPALAWDGTDEQGERVPPGLYLIQLRVEADARSRAAVRTVGIAY